MLRHMYELGKIGRTDALKRHWSAGQTIAWFLTGRKELVYPVGDVIAGMICNKKMIILPQ